MNKELVKLAFRMGYEAAMEKTAAFTTAGLASAAGPRRTPGPVGRLALTGIAKSPQMQALARIARNLQGPYRPETRALGTEVAKQVKRLNGVNDNHGRTAPGLYMAPKTTQLAQQAAVGAKDLLGAK